MKKYILLVLLLATFQVFGQFSNYTNINGRYKWIAGKFDSTFTLPSGTTPSLRVGGGSGPGALFYSTTDSSVYQYTGSQWSRLRGTDTAHVISAYVRNTTGSILTPGQVVYINGSTGTTPTVALAYNKQDSTSAMTFGFVRGNIAVNGFGYITTFGPLEGVNTNAYTEGEVIYLDSIPGQFTHDKPQAPYHMVTLGYIIKKSGGNGTIYAKIQNGYELEELHNVRITAPVLNKSVILYDSVKSLWVDTTLAAAGLITTDSTVVRNQRWKWRNTWEDMSDFEWSTNSKWSAQATGTGAVAIETANAPLTTDTTYFASAQFATGTTATGRAVGLLGNSSSGIAGLVRSFNTKFALYEVGSVWFPTLSDSIGGTDRYIASFGYIDWWNNANPQDGVQFYYDRSTYGNFWVIRSSENGTATTIVTTTPIVAATKYTLRYEITNWQMASSGASIKAYINDVEIVASSGSYPITTNIPRGSNANKNFYPSVLIEKRAGTTSRNLYVDWVYNYLEFITR